MAKKSMIIKDKKKKEKAMRYFKYRRELREKTKDINLTYEERYEANLKLQKLDKNTSHVRINNRCALTGRPRGYLRKFGLSRIAVRDLASMGLLPGVTKSSW